MCGETKPVASLRGDIARNLAFVAFGASEESLPDNVRLVLRNWHKADPVDDAERWRNELFAASQGGLSIFFFLFDFCCCCVVWFLFIYITKWKGNTYKKNI